MYICICTCMCVCVCVCACVRVCDNFGPVDVFTFTSRDFNRCIVTIAVLGRSLRGSAETEMKSTLKVFAQVWALPLSLGAPIRRRSNPLLDSGPIGTIGEGGKVSIRISPSQNIPYSTIHNPLPSHGGPHLQFSR